MEHQPVHSSQMTLTLLDPPDWIQKSVYPFPSSLMGLSDLRIPSRPSEELLTLPLHGTALCRACPSLSYPLLALDPDFSFSCCIPGAEDSPSSAVTAALSPSQCTFGAKTPGLPSAADPRSQQLQPKLPPSCVAVPGDSWSPLLGDTGQSTGALEYHCGKPGLKMQLGLFKAQMKYKFREGVREKMTLKTKVWAAKQFPAVLDELAWQDGNQQPLPAPAPHIPACPGWLTLAMHHAGRGLPVQLPACWQAQVPPPDSPPELQQQMPGGGLAPPHLHAFSK